MRYHLSRISQVLLAVIILTLGACRPERDLSKDYLYFQDADSVRNLMLNFSEYHIREDDILAVGISTASVTQEQLLPFAAVIKNEEGKESRYEFPNYTVDGEGNIQLPLIGRVNVLGLTRREAQLVLEERLGNYISKPTVSVAIKNFSVTLLGEVNVPGRHVLPTPNATLIDAIGAGGDITPFGNRRNILLLRKDTSGVANFSKLDITSAESFLQSNYFQLNQNDVIYVPTNDRKLRESQVDPQKKFQTYTLIFTAVSTIAILLNMVFLFKK